MSDEWSRRGETDRRLIAGIGAVAVVALGANALGALFVSWHLETYFRLTGSWFVVGAIVLICQLSAKFLPRLAAIMAIALAASGVLLNTFIAGRISASC
jgi:hypothetical protein